MAKYVRPKKAEELTGWTVKAMDRKRETGVWREGYEWRKAPDGNILYDLEGIERWVEGTRRAA